MGSMSLVSNIIFARLILKEMIGLQIAIGSAIIIVGVIAIVLPSSQGVNDACNDNLDDLLEVRARECELAFR